MIYRWSAPLALFAALSLSFPQLQAEPTAVSKASRASGTKGQSQQITSPDQVPQGLAKSDWQSIRAAHEAGQHAFQPVQGKDGHWQARNPGQQWHTTFDQRGFMAIPQGGGWTWGLELQSYGFGQQQRAVQGKPGVRAEGQRLSYQWDEDVQEWFVNDQRGLEHGFTIVGRPAADSAPGSQPALLSFTLSTRGGLTPKVASDSVQFLNATGTTVLNYSGLKVWDADGKTLPAHFEPAGIHGFRLLVDESTARYPITIDPVAQQAYLKAGNSGAGDSFGLSVAVSGDTAVVGAYLEDSNATGVNGNAASNDSNDSGAAYVFVRSAGVWTQQAYLKASNTDANDQFGWSVDVDGDTIVIGAWTEDGGAIGVNGDASNNGAIDSGAVYVFTRSGTTWTQQAYLKANNTGAGDLFGVSVALSGDTAVIGANREDSNATTVNGDSSNNTATEAGAAYVFTRSGTTWTQQAYLKANNHGPDDRFGSDVAVSGDTAVIGAPFEDSNATTVNGSGANNTASNAGAAYVFTRSGSAWTQQAYLKANNAETLDNFGNYLAVDGDTAVVGATGEDSNATTVNGLGSNNSASSAGAAYVFTRSGTTWSQQAYLKASNAEANDSFGRGVALEGDTAVIGASFEDSNANTVNGDGSNNSTPSSGAAYVFTRSGGLWSQQTYLKANNPDTTDNFGISVDTSGGTVIVGAYLEDSNAITINGNGLDNSASGSGAAYIFSGLGAAVAAPTLTNVAPNSGPTAGGTSVVITGTDFTGATDVTIGGTAATSFTVDSATQITAVTPAGTAGTASVLVTTTGGTNAANTLFTYIAPPTVTNVIPATGSTLGGTSVVITGTGFTGTSAVTFGGAAATSFTVDSATQITAVTPAGSAGTASVLVTTAGGTNAANTLFTYIAPPTVTNVSPATGSTLGGTSVTITGTGFTGTSAVTFGGTAATSFTVDSATQITAVTPAGSAGTASVLVTSAGGTNAANTLFTYIAPPTVTNVSPATGSTLGGTSVVITGTGFTGASAVTFGGTNATSFTVDSATQITAVTPAGTVGTASVLVTTAGGTNAANTLFTYTAPTPIAALEAYLKAGNAEAGDFFGQVVAVSGDTAVVGAYSEGSNATGVNGNGADNSASYSGAAYIFTRTAGVWTQQAYLKASNSEAYDNFGCSVAVSGDTVVIGAYAEASSATGVNGNQADNSAFYAGAAYVFTRSGSTWTQQAYLKASNTREYDNFGYSVALSGDTAIIGAYGESSNATGVGGNQFNNSATASGAAYVFTRSGTTWTQQAYLKASNSQVDGRFGRSVAVSGDTAVIGAYGEASNATGVNGNQADTSALSSGAAYVFTRSGSTWSQEAYLKASNSQAYDNFGLSVALSGNTAVIGAFAEDSNATGVNGNQADNSTSASGAAYVFTRSAGVWTQKDYLKASNTGTTDRFGLSVAVSGHTAIIGASFEDSDATTVGGDGSNDNATEAGAAYIFNLGQAAIAPTVTNVSPATGSTAGGRSVTITGMDFTGATAVTFGGTAATSFTVDSATQITAVTPAGSAGAVSVLVTTAGGTNAANTLFTYIAPPTVTNVNPATGSTVGGTSVTITGTNFTGATGVTFGGAPASRVRVLNATTISATTPAGTAGPASVLVTTAGGTNAANTLFTYFVPNSAPSFNLPLGDLGPAGVVWTQRTSGFSSWSAITSSADGSKLAAVIFGGLIFTSADSGVTWTARDSSRNWTSITSSADGSKLAAVVSGGQIYTSTDSGVTWTARDSSRNWSSIASSADGSKLAATAYAGSIYTSIDSGVTWTAQASGTFNWQTIASSADGSKLVAGVYGGQVYTSTDSGVTWTARDSSRNWNSIASSTDGSKLAAAVLGGQIYTSTDSGVTWTARDSSRNWNSIASSADGSKLVATVNFNFVYISGDSGVTWTAQDTSRRWIAVASSADGSKLAAAVFNGQIFTSVPAPLPPVVKALAGSGTSTTPNFAFNISPGPASDNGQTVSFTVTNNNNALFTTQPAIANDGTLTFTPGNTVGSAIVTVTAVDNGGTAAGGVDSSAAQTFTIQVLPPAPTVANVAPSSGTTLGGTSVTITGTEFTNATAVTFGGTAATSFTVDSATQITAVTPAGTAGAASVLVTTPSGTNAANTLFTYVVPNFAPVITSNGGDATASINVAENSTAVTTVTATDADLPAQTLTYTKSGADAALFNLDSATGVLRFITAPNFEAPADSGLNNIYDVTVTVTDSGMPALNDVQALTVIVTDVNESPAVRASSSFLAYETVNPTRDGAGLIVYTTNNAAALAAQPFNRVRYRMDNTTGGVAYYADASFDAWGGLTVAGLKVPDAGNIVTTQRSVTNVSIRSNHPGVTNSNTEQGRLELWTNDYATTGIIGGSSTVYDYDDTPQSPVIGYGSFQLHNLSATVPETVFAWNNHAAGVIPDVGFGNATTGIHPDWTFSNTGTNAWRMQIYIENNFVPPTMSFTEDVVGNILFFNSPFLDD
ncbi:IPT/TIG domain-containing protein, partial [Prosthecobacter algae]|uniref:IPT/TIG domain-containing protein n=1 Tax=Prosthecobacter algae TaxID=1144682 RepID=UPI0031EFD9A4